MTSTKHGFTCVPLSRLNKDDTATFGGKSTALAMMLQAGLPVPDGFTISSTAYLRHVQQHELQPQIDAQLSMVIKDDLVGAAAASAAITESFLNSPLDPSIIGDVSRMMKQLALTNERVVVRSSALGEDDAVSSFAGQMSSFLGVSGIDDVLSRIRECWASLWSPEAISYRLTLGSFDERPAMAVLVQRCVDADAAGVAFTRDPVTDRDDRLVIDSSWGLGESVVGGTTTPDSFILDRESFDIIDRSLGDKATITVISGSGTSIVGTPLDQRQRFSVSDAQLSTIGQVAVSAEQVFRHPVDVEWVRNGDAIAVVQARPITSRPIENWNDTTTGDYLWTSGNLGEAVPSVMSPATWSMMGPIVDSNLPVPKIDGIPLIGNIGGRLYLNYGYILGVAKALGIGSMFRKWTSTIFGQVPPHIEVPPLPVSSWTVIRKSIPALASMTKTLRKYEKNLDRMIAEFPHRCDEALTAIDSADNPAALAAVWHTHCVDIFSDAPWLLAAGGQTEGLVLASFPSWLRRYTNDTDAGLLASGVSQAGTLASLQPLLDLEHVANGDMDRDTYQQRWGHRCPDEYELSVPRPAEIPGWIDQQLADLRQGPSPSEKVTQQRKARAAARQRFAVTHPRKLRRLDQMMTSVSRGLRLRELTRSESIRSVNVLRQFWLRAGELCELDERVFLLHHDELITILEGGEPPIKTMEARQRAWDRYRDLPPLPTLIRGHFDPISWTTDPNRIVGIHDGSNPSPTATPDDLVTGMAGSTGVARGKARVLTHHNQAHSLRHGEILVTPITNIGWTPVFPRVAAIVTDVGAPLSHAAIVARELGIPAVVGCRDATARISTGDEVIVDGGMGTVRIEKHQNLSPIRWHYETRFFTAITQKASDLLLHCHHTISSYRIADSFTIVAVSTRVQAHLTPIINAYGLRMAMHDVRDDAIPGQHIPYPSEPGEPLYCQACTCYFDAPVRWECLYTEKTVEEAPSIHKDV